MTALLAAFSAAILTAIGAGLIARFQARKDAEQRALDRDFEGEQARLEDERRLRDAKRERLRLVYEDVTFAAIEIQNATVQLGVIWGGDTQEEMNERVNARLDEATKDLGRAIVRLRIEGEETLADTYAALRGLWFQYTSEYAEVLGGRGRGRIIETLAQMQAAVDGILDKVKTDMAKLSAPI